MMLLNSAIHKSKTLLNVSENRLLFHQIYKSSVAEKDNPAHHCLKLVKRTDHEHYLTNLLLPEKIITDSFAIRALNAEISGVRDNVTDKTLGLVRLQFWQDSIGWYSRSYFIYEKKNLIELQEEYTSIFFCEIVAHKM